jgi:hypothetical protein
MIVKIKLRCEGDVNRFVRFHYQDGSVESFSAIEGSFEYDCDNSRVWEKDLKLDLLLGMLSNLCYQYIKSDYHSVDVELDSHMRVKEVVHQDPM